MSQTDDVSLLLDSAIEATRLAALRALRVLDTPPEEAFDDLVWLAAQLCDAPIAAVSLVDADRQWFKARCGLEIEQTARSEAFCAHALASDALLEVDDARCDARFSALAAVREPDGIRFYAGAPLVGRHGHRYGTLCVADTRVRSLTAEQRDGLVRLARRASAALEARRERLDAEQRERTLVHLLDAIPNGVVTCDADGVLAEFNHTARTWHGADARDVPADEWSEHFGLFEADGETPLPPERVPLRRAWLGEHVRDVEIVIRPAGQPQRTVLCNAEPLTGPDGACLGAVCTLHDVTRLKAAQENAAVEAQRFGDAFAAAAQGMALVSLDGRWLEVNDALCAMFGYSREALLALDFQRLTHPEDLQADLGLVAELVLGRRVSYQLDKRYFDSAGRTLHAHLSVSLVRSAQGKPLHFVAQIQDRTDRHQAEQRLRESELRFRSVLENSHDAFVAVDEGGAIVEWNRAAEATFGWRRSEVIGRAMSEVIVPPRMRSAHEHGMQRFLRTSESRVLDQRLQLPAWHRSGHEFPIEMTITVVQLGLRRVFNAFLHDITDRVAAENRLRESEHRLRTVADNVPALIGRVGPDLRYEFVNRPYAEHFGLACEDIVGRTMQEILTPVHYANVRPMLERVLAGERVVFDMDVASRDGDVRHMHASYIPDLQAGDAAGPARGGFHLMVHDLTAQTRLARMLTEQAMTDALTGLPNRAAWTAELERGLARAQRAGTSAAVMFIDLDGFKQVNDAYGHETGDAVLREFAQRLRATLRRSDFIARLAGDEFVVLLDRVTDAGGNPPIVAEKLVQAMAVPMHVNGHELTVSPSIGLAVQMGPVFDAAALMRRADEAMYSAKRCLAQQYKVSEH